MKNSFAFIIVIILIVGLFSSCAKFDYHSQVEVTDESGTLDMHQPNNVVA